MTSLWFFIISHLFVKFGEQRPRGSEDISFFICQETSRDHVISGLRDHVDNTSSSEATVLSSLLAISLAKGEI